MINVMQTEERSASVTHSVQNLRWLPHHCTTDNSGQRGNAACGYTNCILAMLTLHNAKISFPRRDLVRWYRCDALLLRTTTSQQQHTDRQRQHTWHRHPHVACTHQPTREHSQGPCTKTL